MCVVCQQQHGIPTNVALDGTLYMDMPLCRVCLQLACATRDPVLKQAILARLDRACE